MSSPIRKKVPRLVLAGAPQAGLVKPLTVAAPKPEPKQKPKAAPKPKPEPKSNIQALRPAPPAQPEPLAMPTDEAGVAGAVERLAGLGLSVQDMAYILNRSVTDITASFPDAIQSGSAKANFRVTNALFTTAIDRGHRGHVTAAIYWTKARLGWRDQGESVTERLSGDLIEGPSDDEIAARFEGLMGAFSEKKKASSE